MMTSTWGRLTAFICCIGLCVLHGQVSRVGFFVAGIQRAMKMTLRPLDLRLKRWLSSVCHDGLSWRHRGAEMENFPPIKTPVLTYGSQSARFVERP